MSDHRRRLEERRVPIKYARVFIAGEIDEATEAMKAVREFEAQAEKTILLLCGNVGVGKSFAACAWLDSFDSGLFVTAQALRRMSTYDEVAYQRVSAPYRLVIDDIGSEYADSKDFWEASFDGLMNDRYLGERPVVLSSNGAPESFFKRYGDRVKDRMREVGMVVDLAGKSRRVR